MSNGLISRQELLKALNKWDITKLYLVEDVKELVKEQPTAYDPEEVVKQLMVESISFKESADEQRCIGNELVYRVFRAKSEALAEEAIEIVKGGQK